MPNVAPADEQDDDVGGAQGAAGVDPQGHQRSSGESALDGDERAQHGDPADDQGQRRCRAPAGGVGADDAEDEQAEADRRRQGAGQVERAGAGGVPPLGQQALRGDGGDQADRDVDEQDPAPGQRAGEDAAEQDPGRSAGAAHGAPDADRPVASGALAERRGEDGQRRGCDHRAPQALDRPGRDEDVPARRRDRRPGWPPRTGRDRRRRPAAGRAGRRRGRRGAGTRRTSPCRRSPPTGGPAR